MKDILPALKDPKSPEHNGLLTHVQKLVSLSRKEMSRNYARWDQNDAEFRSQKRLDKEDRNATAKGQPAKMIVPLSKSQVLTFVAYCLMTTTQNPRFFELEPTGKEDDVLAEPSELILERDIRRNKWSSFLTQFFLDIGRFTLGAAEVCYEEVTRNVRIESNETSEESFGEEVPQKTQTFVSLPIFVGNRVHSLSPYRFFPDTRLPLSRYQEGEFCASEDFFSYNSLVSDPSLFNVDKIPRMDKKELDERKKTTRGTFDDFQTRLNPNMESGPDSQGYYVTDGMVLVTKTVVDVIPANVKINGEPLGPETFPMRKVIWYGNDKTILRYDDGYWLHGMFPYVCAQFLPDQHKFLSDSLADDCSGLTNQITWTNNAHITSIRNSIESRWVVDPAGVDVKSLESRSPYIYLKRNASQMGVDRFIQQFKTVDPSVNFINEMGGLVEMLERCTGFGNNMMGQYSSGRRDATQSRAVSQGATSRAKMILSNIWDSAFEPLAKQFLSNNRQEMDFDTFQAILGSGPFGMTATNPDGVDVQTLYAQFHADPITIARSEDFFVFDGTLPSEKQYLAQSIQEVLTSIFTNPEVAPILGYGPQQVKQLFAEMFTLRGMTNSRLPTPTMGARNAPPPIMALPNPSATPTGGPSPVSNGQ